MSSQPTARCTPTPPRSSARTGRRCASHRAGVTDLIDALSKRCDLVARYIIPGDVAARVKLDGNGLRFHIDKGGDCTTAAIDSLKVVIFDLAVLTLGIEGTTGFPGFLLHDSPREADLDLAVYHRIFELADVLETFGPGPLFQYVITTTTAPPLEVSSGERLRPTLHGAPSSKRLLTVDL